MIVDRAGNDDSSAPVSSTNASSPARTVSAAPTNERLNIADARDFSGSVQYDSMSSIGGGSFPRRPRKIFANDCCAEVKSRRAVASSSATTAFAPTIAYGSCSCSDGRNVDR